MTFKYGLSPLSGDFPLPLCCVPCLAKSSENFLRQEFQIFDIPWNFLCLGFSTYGYMYTVYYFVCLFTHLYGKIAAPSNAHRYIAIQPTKNPSRLPVEGSIPESLLSARGVERRRKTLRQPFPVPHRQLRSVPSTWSAT